jgi:hypothetical protein
MRRWWWAELLEIELVMGLMKFLCDHLQNLQSFREEPKKFDRFSDMVETIKN